ncbi:DUF1559 domain-containing protein [Planctomicrobium sp. SH661]|uniref:DUF1559 family PulG-like putative transporter n=1 Tax=Planctomicrobium sp. SH661 TaxID=3448124 RepID=UPI003F5C2C52
MYEFPQFLTTFVLLTAGVLAAQYLIRSNRIRRVVQFGTIAFMLLLVAEFFLGSPSDSIKKRSLYQCLNNERNVGVALQNYIIIHNGRFPPLADGDPPVSWRVEMLPFLDQAGLHERYDRDATWNDPRNSPATTLDVPVFRCPVMPKAVENSPVETAFAIPHGTGGIYSPAGILTIEEITDGTSQTLMLVEAAGQHIVWTEPRDVDFDQLPIGVNLPGARKGESDGIISSYHPGMATATFADGSGRWLSNSIDPSVLLKLLRANDGKLNEGEF